MARAPLTQRERIVDCANALAKERDRDVFFFNYSIEPGIEHLLRQKLAARAAKRSGLILLLTTEGGDPDAAYRIARTFQDAYAKMTIVVGGWCKSAGTLVCIAADDLVIADDGELGPLDTQIAKADEVGERSSGLAVDAAFEKMQKESFKLFIGYLSDIKEKTRGRITFKTAAEIAAQLVIGATSEIFAKLDPVTIGEDYRSNLVGSNYAMRLNVRAKNLKSDARFDALEFLLEGYRSHAFVIDRKEASQLFVRVQPPNGRIAELLELLGNGVVFPLSGERSETPRLEYLNDEKRVAQRPSRAATPAPSARAKRRGSNGTDGRAVVLPRDISAGAGEKGTGRA